VPVPDQPGGLQVISLGPALAEAIRRIHEGESVSALFDQPELGHA
jgi:ribose-phosphate pyrophosphokinase